MALGEVVAEDKGQVTGMRVLSTDESGTEIEVSLSSAGTICGVASTSMWTYTQVIRPDGSIRGSGRGITTTSEGDVIHLIGNGSGKAAAPGETTEFRVFIQPYSASQKYCEFNTIGWVGEFAVAGDGTTVGTFWAWK